MSWECLVSCPRVSFQARRPRSRPPRTSSQRRSHAVVSCMDKSIANATLVALQGHSIGTFLITLLSNVEYEDCPLRHVFVDEFAELLKIFSGYASLETPLLDFSARLHTKTLTAEIAAVSQRNAGWHFSAKHARPEQLETFGIDKMATKLHAQIPRAWDLVGALLESDHTRTRRRAQYLSRPTQSAAGGVTPSKGTTDLEWDDEDEYWAQVEDEMVSGAEEEDETDRGERVRKRRRIAGERRQALLQIVSLSLSCSSNLD